MYFSESVTLQKITLTADSFGGLTVETPADTAAFADKKSVARTEFYSSSMAGIKLDAMFQIHAEDFNNQTRLVYGTTTYDIVRAYQKGEGIVELSCAVREVT